MQVKTILFQNKGVRKALFLSFTYLLLSYLFVGFKTDQLVLLLILNLLYFASSQTRKIFIVCMPYVIFWILFDYMKAFPNYDFNQVSIEELYNAEKNLFGFFSNGHLVTPNQYFIDNTHKILDILSGIFYLSWVPVPILLTIYFLYTKREQAVHLSVAFLLVNLVGFVFYYIYPAAPPWYVAKYGFEFIKNTPGSAAGLIRFDNAFGIRIFQSMYEKSSNVFAAMPSLHSAYPLIALYFAVKNRIIGLSIIIAITAFGIWFCAVYTSHHYILDVLGGILCAIVGIALYEILYQKLFSFRKMINRLCLHLNTT